IIVASGDRVFQYWHLSPDVYAEERVVARHTVLGLIRPKYHHVHFTEIRDGIVQNPLAPGHLWPYRDSRPPSVGSISLLAPGGGVLNPLALRGPVVIVASAEDLPALPIPGPWRGFPVTPARLAWQLTAASGSLVPAP